MEVRRFSMQVLRSRSSRDKPMPEKFNFLEQVNRTFDRAGELTDHDPTLLSQIRECNGLYHM